MGAGSPFLFLLLACLTALTPLALASPPDQTWIAGIYDDADYDDVVWLVVAGEKAIPAGDDALAQPLLPLANGRVPTGEDRRALPSPPLASPSRAPPTS